MPGLLERMIWFSALLLAGLLALLVAALTSFGGRVPDLKPLPSSRVATGLLPSGHFAELFATSSLPLLAVPTNVVSPFFTLHFQPPAPPPTKKVPLLYLGFTQSPREVRRAYVSVADALVILPLGAKVIADHAIQGITAKALTLTNVAGQTNVFEFNTTKPIEVPAG